MIVEVRAKNQITIPKEISKSLGINVGDQFDMIEKDGMVYMIPVVTYPKAYMDELDKEMEQLRVDIKSGKAKGFTDIDEMLAYLHGKR
ncbi:MAG: AbrB/MazE/SpoVT family DNA-binding domain-containing protein [bacterium]|nr:AbrB/MazE/SpoVT family DNA-binding domain-containing protein [bacterium]